MNIHYQLTEEDFIQFNLFHLQNSKVGKRSLRLQQFISPVIFIGAAFLLSMYSNLSFIPLLIGFGLVSIGWMLFFPKYYVSLIRRNVRKMFREGRNDGLLGERQMILSDEGIVDRSKNGETTLTWRAIEKMAEDETHIYLYNSSVSAYILPKRDLSELTEVKAYLYTQISS